MRGKVRRWSGHDSGYKELVSVSGRRRGTLRPSADVGQSEKVGIGRSKRPSRSGLAHECPRLRSITAIPAHEAMQTATVTSQDRRRAARAPLGGIEFGQSPPQVPHARLPCHNLVFRSIRAYGYNVRSQEREELRFVSKIEPLSQLQT